MKISKEEQEMLTYFRNIAQQKKYKQEIIELAAMLCCTTDMVKKYGNEKNALKEIIKLCEECDNSTDFMGKIGALINL